MRIRMSGGPRRGAALAVGGALAAGLAVSATGGPASAAPPVSSVYISEFMASTNGGFPDQDGASSDWIEIYNSGSSAVDLAGWRLRDSNAPGWTFPTTVVPAGGRIVVFASNKNRAISGSELHTNFALSANGEYLALLQPGGAIAHEYTPGFPAQTVNVSYGINSAGDERYFSTPTPGTANNLGDLAPTGAVTASPGRGFYTSPIAVTLASSTSGATIRYTTDGSAPSATTGTVYSGPINISTTTNLRAIATSPGRPASAVFTATYVFVSSVIQQGTGIPGFPNGRTVAVGGGSSVPEDTAMDTDITNSPTYSSQMVDALTSIPTMSLTAPLNTVFGSGSFYDADEVERPVSVELLYPNDPASNSQIDAGVESHSHNRLKRSLRINFRSAYGSSTWVTDLLRRAPVGGGSATDSIKTLILRGGNNRAWSRVFNPDATDFTLDELVRGTQVAMSGFGSHGTFVHLYLNGVYWGLYNIAERPDDDWAASYFPGADTDFFFINHGTATNGDATRWNYLTTTLAAKDMSNATNYAELQQYLDVEAFADYLLNAWWFGVTDWPTNNWYAHMRTTTPTTPARYVAWDGEWSMDRKIGNPHQGAWVNPEFAPNASPSTTLGILWKSAWASTQFRATFASRVALHTAPGGALTDASVRARYDALNAFVEDAVIAESARWGDSLESLGQPTRTRDVDWQREVDVIRDLIDGNTAQFLSALSSAGYYTGPTAPPNAPTNPAAASSGANVNFTWTDASNNESGFEVQRARWVAGTWTEWAAWDVGPNTTSYTDTNVPDGFYAYLVRSKNALGNSAWAITVVSHTTATTAPTAPSGLNLTNSGPGVQLAWTDNAGSEHYFDVGRARYNPTTQTWGEWTFFIADRNATSYVDAAVADGQYAYLVRAVNPLGASDWVISVIVHANSSVPPTAPTNLTATPSGGTGVALTWTDPSGEVYVELQRARWDGTGWTDWTTRVFDRDTTAATDNPGAAGTYAYLVRGSNPSGASDWAITTVTV